MLTILVYSSCPVLPHGWCHKISLLGSYCIVSLSSINRLCECACTVHPVTLSPGFLVISSSNRVLKFAYAIETPYIHYGTIWLRNVMFALFQTSQETPDYDINDVAIDEDGIVRLRLENTDTQKKVWEQISKLKNIKTAKNHE